MTKCSICEHANPPLARECESCGMQLTLDSDAAAADGQIQDRVHQLVAEGNKIEAIKLYREQTGCGLVEAKNAVEALLRGETPPPVAPRPQISSSIDQDIVALLHEGRKIEAIKLYIDQVGGGLRDAKSAVDTLAREHGIEAAGKSGGCLSLLILGLTLTATAGYLLT
ncbi:hypothetical protein Pan258_24880 [Symmachiella dynata]|uniref:ribosomal protein L7/L12 n=1 Tax=Symmachiella dynata TaxID=2527995 RepID=UPI00118B8FF5|nr:ribosomal protein L7/L12 [Symmachiella dynata]QDT48446.1 hypothetical protein Pan258_24880 [Symmachiella dynata]